MIHSDIGYRIIKSTLGDVGLVWHRAHRATKIIEIMLPMPGLRQYIQKRHPRVQQKGAPNIDVLSKKLKQYLAGEQVRFGVENIDMSRLYRFQRTVLLCERQIPYGWVSTYGRLAVKIGNPGAARAVGTALARNPFPLVIPCHRTIRANGFLGGFQGGTKMKRALLELEGIQFQGPDKIAMNRVW